MTKSDYQLGFSEGYEKGRREMASAAADAAGTAATAIERIQEMEKVVKAAEAWSKGASHAILMDAVASWEIYKKKWS